MAFTFVPDFRFDKFNDISSEFLLSLGVKAVLLDIDNTLEPYENALPGEHVIAWLSSLSEVGISAAIVSNNERERVDTFNESLGLIAFSKAKKPFKKRLVMAMKLLGVTPAETVFIGDQVFTDVWAARNAKIKAILVSPIRDKRNFITRLKRKLEVPVLKKYEKRKKKESEKNDKA